MKYKKEYRDLCKQMCRNHDCAWLVPESGNIHLKITFHPPNKRHFDMDNCLARLKAGLDGVADAWDINDIRFRPITIDMGAPEKNGRVLVEIINP